MAVPAYDVIIRGGLVYNGTGAPPFEADVAGSDGRIAAVGKIDDRAARTIDATGLAVAPGFIDVHSHDDVALISNPGLDFKAAQGVTTVVCGNCGAGAAPANERLEQFFRRGVEGILGPVEAFRWRTPGEFFRAVGEAGPSVNAAFLVPHGALRVYAMGWERRPPTDDELAVMKEQLAEGMEAGAVGMSTGLIYVPGTFAETGELIELAKVVARYGGLYASHIRDESERLLEAVREAIRIGEEAGVPVQISHHKAGSRTCWGMTERSLPLIDAARARGIDVTIDAYPYIASSTSLVAYTRNGRLMREVVPSDIVVASVKRQHQYEGKRLDEMAAMMDLPVEDAVSKLLEDEDNAVAIVHFSMDEGDVRRVLRHETCMIGSDGIPSPTGKPHPRLYGTFARVLGTYVREEGLLSLEEAVRRMTSLPARKFKLEDRGEVRAGAWADLVVFDPARIADVATYEEPRRYPEGIDYVLVNGRVIVEEGRPQANPAGQVLTRAT